MTLDMGEIEMRGPPFKVHGINDYLAWRCHFITAGTRYVLDSSCVERDVERKPTMNREIYLVGAGKNPKIIEMSPFLY